MVFSEGPLSLVSTGPLLALPLDRRQPLGRQIEGRLRELIRSEGLPLGAELPSTRALAADLGVSRGVVVGAYAQLAAEGYITLRRSAAPVVATSGRLPDEVPVDPEVHFRRATCLPDAGLFPRAHWLASMRATLHRARAQDFAYGEPLGAADLRRQLAAFLTRTRGVFATPDRTCVFAGSSQALHALGSVLRAGGAKRIGVEDPGHRWRTRTIAASGLEIVPVPVDGEGLRVERLPDDIAAVVVSPANHFPLGVALSSARRRDLVDWAAAGGRLVIEHDYDAHFRYDRSPAGALQPLAPEHVAYVGSASALLAPTLRIGWAVPPARLVAPLVEHVFATAIATSRMTQLAVAEFIARGYLDRHLRKSAVIYGRRRDALVAALARHVPEAAVTGGAVGLYLSLSLPETTDEAKLLAAAWCRGVVLDGNNEHALTPQPPGLAFGFAGGPEGALRYAARRFGEAVQELEPAKRDRMR
jgi:GntR family transcriptional regulator/MocR family aminotransferase